MREFEIPPIGSDYFIYTSAIFTKKFKVDDIGSKYRPIINENLTVPILSTELTENDGCPFAGFDKRNEKKKRRTSKESRPKKGSL